MEYFVEIRHDQIQLFQNNISGMKKNNNLNKQKHSHSQQSNKYLTISLQLGKHLHFNPNVSFILNSLVECVGCKLLKIARFFFMQFIC